MITWLIVLLRLTHWCGWRRVTVNSSLIFIASYGSDSKDVTPAARLQSHHLNFIAKEISIQVDLHFFLSVKAKFI